jgi:hypothetical protein
MSGAYPLGTRSAASAPVIAVGGWRFVGRRRAFHSNDYVLGVVGNDIQTRDIGVRAIRARYYREAGAWD